MIAVRPTLQELLAYRGNAEFAVLSTELHADIDTPITAFAKLAEGAPEAFLLESAESGGRFGRWSFMGASIKERLTMADGVVTANSAAGENQQPFSDPLDPIATRLQPWSVWSPVPLPPFSGGAVGYIGFDCIRYFEPVPLPAARGLGLPEAALLVCDEVHAYDHLRHRIVSVVHIPMSGDRAENHAAGVARLAAAQRKLCENSGLQRAPWGTDQANEALDFVVNRSPDNMRSAVLQAQESIAAGETFQVVVSQRVSASAAVDPLVLYRALRSLNPSPYMFLLRLPGFSVVGASPEVLVRCQSGKVLVRPIAGTRRRGVDDAEDAALAEELQADEKEVAEHRMLVDLGRNDVGRIAKVGSVRLADPMHIERYSHVMHMVSDVHGELADGLTMFDALRACFPAGTVSGAPKVRACELLATLEPDRRGPYAGAIGYFGATGDMDTAIAIRTLVVQDDSVHVQAGAGIVWDSVPENERVECLHKAKAPLAAVQLALGAK